MKNDWLWKVLSVEPTWYQPSKHRALIVLDTLRHFAEQRDRIVVQIVLLRFDFCKVLSAVLVILNSVIVLRHVPDISSAFPVLHQAQVVLFSDLLWHYSVLPSVFSSYVWGLIELLRESLSVLLLHRLISCLPDYPNGCLLYPNASLAIVQAGLLIDNEGAVLYTALVLSLQVIVVFDWYLWVASQAVVHLLLILRVKWCNINIFL